MNESGKQETNGEGREQQAHERDADVRGGSATGAQPTGAQPTGAQPTSAASERMHDEKSDSQPETEAGVAAGDPASSVELESSAANSTRGPASGDGGLARGRRPFAARGWAIFALGVTIAFLLMSWHHEIYRGALWVALAVGVAAFGLLDGLGLLFANGYAKDELEAAVAWDTGFFRLADEPIWMSPLVTFPAALGVMLLGEALFGFNGLPYVILTALAVLLVSALRRPPLLVFVVGAFVVGPFLGAFGLWDPWETHYGEVAREILSRNDWISTWWAHESWFFSKPILIFWIEALSMSMLGTDYHPDAHPPSPEWSVRMPHFILAMSALLAVYALISRNFGRRAGLLCGAVLATTPHFFFLSHQAITDLPFVTTMTIAICMLGLSVTEPEDRLATRYRVGLFVLSLQHGLLIAFTFACIPQIVLLLTRNVTFYPQGFAWHLDILYQGSAGNGGNPGNPEYAPTPIAFNGFETQPLVQGLVWLAGFVAIVAMLRRERRTKHLFIFAFYLACALSFMAKGIPGFGLPGMVAMLWLMASRRWFDLLSGRLRVAAGMLIVATVGLPWYVAMYIRHGQAFTDRLLIHDHINRLTTGVHGDTGSIEYFLEQLGFGLFPWIALAPIAAGLWILMWNPRSDSNQEHEPPGAGYRQAAASGEDTATAHGVGAPFASRNDVVMLLGLWGTAAFVLFSAMTTKFHHYIFPAVPPAAILIGLAVDRLFGPPSDLTSWKPREMAGTALALLAPTPITIGIAGLWGDVRGVAPEGMSTEQTQAWVLAHPWPSLTCAMLMALGGAMLAGAWWLLRVESDEPGSDEANSRWLPAAVSTGLFAAPALVGLVGRDLAWATSSHPEGYERLIHLFVYNYERPWPDQFDFRPILTGFAFAATVAIALAALPIVRQVALRAFFGVALAFAVWCLDFYIVDLSPHWGQKELLDLYYETRTGPEEEIFAWQMNWKGENFYSGNRVYTFVDLDNRELNEWIDAHPAERVFFVLEHSRLASLRSTLRGMEVEEISDKRLDNKFVLVRVVLRGSPQNGSN